MKLSPDNPTTEDSITISGSGRKPSEKILFTFSDEHGKIDQRVVTTDNEGFYEVQFNGLKPCEYKVEAYLVVRSGKGLILLDRKTVEVQDGTGSY